MLRFILVLVVCMISTVAVAGPGHSHGEEESDALQITLMPGLHGAYTAFGAGAQHWEFAARLGLNLAILPQEQGRPTLNLYAAVQVAFLPDHQRLRPLRVVVAPAFGVAIFNDRAFGAIEVEGHAAHFDTALLANAHVRLGPQLPFARLKQRGINLQVGATYGLWPVVSEGLEEDDDHWHDAKPLYYGDGRPVPVPERPDPWQEGDYYAHGPGLWLMLSTNSVTVHCRLSGGWALPGAAPVEHSHGVGSFLGECGVDVPFGWAVKRRGKHAESHSDHDHEEHDH